MSLRRMAVPDSLQDPDVEQNVREPCFADNFATPGVLRRGLNFRVVRAMDLIESEYGVSRLNLDMLSRRLGVTKCHFCRVFRRSVGIGLPEYVRRVRARKAEQLLRETNLSIKEVTAAVGFACVTQMDRAFVEVYRCPPTEYRNRNSGVISPAGS